MSTLLERVKSAGVPRHVAIIMDGNGRWARARGLSRTAGHEAGARAAERLVRFIGHRLGIAYITLFAFSAENWGRPKAEVDFLLALLDRFIAEHLREFVDSGIRLRVVGDVSTLPITMQRTVAKAVETTRGGTNLNLTIALSYGGRQDITRACQRILADVAEGRLGAEDVSEEAIARRLDTAETPDPDLVIRTSGERRFSNFLLWQSAYAELYFTDVLWPDFSPADLVRAIDDFQKRERRFGAVAEVAG
ncbi:MAG: isoprenyl transferase [Candidatus Bipolaricaulota bacterium]|nr:isoprenyl transferase [Candidatus Bipolaricaulota bacterium]